MTRASKHSSRKKQPAMAVSKQSIIILCLFFFFTALVAAAAVAESSINGDNTDPKIDNNGRNSAPSSNNNKSSQQISYPAAPLLDSNSVILITGAAGFLGSELALALKRTYNVKKLLLVDHLGMESDDDNERTYDGSNNKKKTKKNTKTKNKTKAVYEKYDEEKLSLFELKRQRVFRIFQELTSSSLNNDLENDYYSSAESIKFYRADMRPSIPEFFDVGELPLLEGIFGSHPDITHVVHLADEDVNNQNQVVPRKRDSVKAGRMESILEELRLILERRAAEAKAQAAAAEMTVTAEGGASSDDSESEEQEVVTYEPVFLPQFVYASSYEVYDYLSTAAATATTTTETITSQKEHPNPLPFREDKPITTPSSLHGAAKLIDEILASAYHSTHGIYSVGLRFFPVYGPWSNPGTDVFDLTVDLFSQIDDDDDAIGNEENAIIKDDSKFDEDVKDYIYIDDAVDAIMSAMQYRPPGQDPPPVVFNVGTGKGTTLKQIRDEMMSHFPPNSFDNSRSSQTTMHTSSRSYFSQRQATSSYASTERSKTLLGFEAQVPLSVGLAKTLEWFRDRSAPFGKDPDEEVSPNQKNIDSFVANSLEKATREKCSPFDRECLRGTPIFPCASECSRSKDCTPSAWDDVASLSRLLTSGCDAVMFTILLDKDAERIPSATVAATSDSLSFVPDIDGVGKRTHARCNIAFVSEDSPLVQRLRSEGGEVYYSDESDKNKLPPMTRHGFWTVLPVNFTTSDWLHAVSGSFALDNLPKISPGHFFASSVRYAIFVDPTVLIDVLPELLKMMDDGPPIKNSDVAMMVMEKRQSCDVSIRGSTCPWKRPGNNDSIQRTMHNMVRVALKGDLLGGGLSPVIDSSFLAHSLQGDDARMLRCDVYSDAAQWGASNDENSLEFILSLHDFWSRADNHWSSRESSMNGSANTEDLLFGVLSSSDIQVFTQIVRPDRIGIIQL